MGHGLSCRRPRDRRPDCTGRTLADADRLHTVVPYRLAHGSTAIRGDRVAAPGQPAELGEHEPADGVVGVGIDRQIHAIVGQIGDRHVAAHEPIAVGEPSNLARAWSVSSAISPTTSSMMSSTVTIPATRPYSSTTTAIEVRWRCSSASRSSSGLVSGTIGASCTIDSIEACGPSRISRPARTLACTSPRMRSRSSSSVTTTACDRGDAAAAARSPCPREDRPSPRQASGSSPGAPAVRAGERPRRTSPPRRGQDARRRGLGDQSLQLIRGAAPTPRSWCTPNSRRIRAVPRSGRR